MDFEINDNYNETRTLSEYRTYIAPYDMAVSAHWH